MLSCAMSRPVTITATSARTTQNALLVVALMRQFLDIPDGPARQATVCFPNDSNADQKGRQSCATCSTVSAFAAQHAVKRDASTSGRVGRSFHSGRRSLSCCYPTQHVNRDRESCPRQAGFEAVSFGDRVQRRQVATESTTRPASPPTAPEPPRHLHLPFGASTAARYDCTVDRSSRLSSQAGRPKPSC